MQPTEPKHPATRAERRRRDLWVERLEVSLAVGLFAGAFVLGNGILNGGDGKNADAKASKSHSRRESAVAKPTPTAGRRSSPPTTGVGRAAQPSPGQSVPASGSAPSTAGVPSSPAPPSSDAATTEPPSSQPPTSESPTSEPSTSSVTSSPDTSSPDHDNGRHGQ